MKAEFIEWEILEENANTHKKITTMVIFMV